MKNWILKGMAFMAIAMVGLSSCQKEDTTSVEEFVNDAVYQMQADGSLGKLGCFELVFPVSIAFPDNTTATYNNYAEMAAGIREWKANNPGGSGRPQFVFPIDILKSDGTTVTVSSKDELAELRKECPGRKGRGPKGHIGRGLACYELVFPVTLVLPDNTEVIANTSEELRAALKAWKEANPGRGNGRPHLKLPFDVAKKDDGSVVTINSREDLKTLKENCE